MLNTDMCLFFDLESNYPCCSRNDLLDGDGGNRCVDEALSQNPCLPYGETHRRKEAADAVEAFALGGGRGFNNDNNGPFYTAFAKAWANATTNGWNSLQPLSESCSPAPPPTTSPTNLSTTSSPTSSPTQPPTVTSSSPPPTPSCTDIDSFTDGNGRLRTCSFVVDGRNRCGQFAHLCPVTCGECDCLLTRRVCNSNNDCCSGVCGLDGLCACRPRNAVCESDKECCSGQCSSGSCAGRSRLFG